MEKNMKAIIWTKFGPPDGLQLKEIEKPVPKEDEVLIKIHATTVSVGDCEMRSLKFGFPLSLLMRMYVGYSRPKRVSILGMALAGKIEAVGKDVTLFRKGDQVFASTGFSLGAYAEYKCLPEKSKGMAGQLAMKPVNMTFVEAASVPVGGFEALHFLRQANIRSGQKVLINGAGGSIGTMAVQLSKHFGADVTGVDSREKLDMLRSIGADKVIDYTVEDFTKNGEIYDVIFDVIGKSPFSRSIKSLNQNGFYLLANPKFSYIFRGIWTSITSGKKVISGAANGTTEDLIFLKELIEAGKIKSVIDRSYTLEQIPEAHKYVDTGQKKGNVAVSVAHN